MHKYDHRIGVTEDLIQRAAHYLRLGEGIYIADHTQFDRVEVTLLYDITPNANNEFEYAFGSKVSFFKQDKLIKWIEFSSRTVGAGGADILKEVEITKDPITNG